jgi:hypothetical protein
MLVLSLKRKIPDIFDYSFVEGFVKTIAAAAGGAVVLQFLKAPIALAVDMETGFGVLLQGLGAGIGGLAVYYLLGRYFDCPGVPSRKQIKNFLLRKNS